MEKVKFWDNGLGEFYKEKYMMRAIPREYKIENNVEQKNEIWRRMRSRSSNYVGRPLHIDKVESKNEIWRRITRPGLFG